MFNILLGKSPSTPIPDPYNLTPPVPNVSGGATNETFPDWNNTNGRVLVSSTTIQSSNTITLVTAGQSLLTNCVNGTYTPTNAGAYNFNIQNGGLYKAADPLLGCTGYHPNLPGNPWPTGSWETRLPDLLINAGKATNVIMVPIGVGGSNVLDWQVGGGNNPRVGVAYARLLAAGITPTAFLWEQGTSNNNGTTQSTYQTALTSLITTVQSYWSNLPVFVALESRAGNGTTSSAVRAAQAAVVNHVANIWQGPDTDSLSSSFRQTDNLHWNSSAGSSAVAGLWQTALGLFGPPF